MLAERKNNITLPQAEAFAVQFGTNLTQSTYAPLPDLLRTFLVLVTSCHNGLAWSKCNHPMHKRENTVFI